MRLCNVPDCTRRADVPGTARGLCVAHYNRWRRTGDVQCNVAGCSKPIGKYGEAGFCAEHRLELLA